MAAAMTRGQVWRAFMSFPPSEGTTHESPFFLPSSKNMMAAKISHASGQRLSLRRVDSMKLAILLSGRGSNFEAIHSAIAAGALRATIVCVISNRPDARGIERARELGLPARVFDHKRYPTRVAHEEDVLRALAEAE